MKIINWENLTFKEEITYPDYEIDEGKTYFVCGKSGSGKSTLLKLINGVNPLENGDIHYKGKSVKEVDLVELRQKIMLVGQSPFLFEGTIRENFEKFHQLRENIQPSEEEMLTSLTLCKIGFSLEKKCGRMSGGERQRVFIAICLSLRPEVLMLDEPTSALDKDNARELIGNIKKLGKTILVVSHDKNLAEEFGDHILNLEEGHE